MAIPINLGERNSGEATAWGMLPSAVPFLLAYTIFPLTILAAVKGGWFVFAPFWTLLAGLDLFAGNNLNNRSTETPRQALFFHELLVWLWVPLQAATYVVVFHQLFWSDHLGPLEQTFVVIAAGRATAFSLTVGHELCHRRSKLERGLGEFVMSFAGLGHYGTEHVYLHHAHVATPYDPVTARKGENVYAFVLRAAFGAIRHSWRADRERLHRRGHSGWHRSNPWWRYAATLMFWLAVAWCVAAFGPGEESGWAGIAAYLGIIAIANFSIRVVDYFEHYGLLRVYTGKGRFEPTRPRHSWNAAGRISSWIMFNLQRHSDHHYKPMRAYPLLQTYDESEAPQLPVNYVAMYYCALIPPLWRRVMHPRLDAWRQRFYPEIQDWSPYESPLFYRYPEKFPIIAETMAADSRLSDWMHRHPAVLEGRHTPEEAHLALAGLDLEKDWEEIAQRGLVTLFYREELTPAEIAEQLSNLAQSAEGVCAAADSIRPWLEDRSFHLELHRLRGHLEPGVAARTFARIIEGAVLQLAVAVDHEFDEEFDSASLPSPWPPAIYARDSLARADLAVGGTLCLSVDPEGEAAQEQPGTQNFQEEWTQRFLTGMRHLFRGDFPCTFSGDLSPGTESTPDCRPLRPDPEQA